MKNKKQAEVIAPRALMCFSSYEVLFESVYELCVTATEHKDVFRKKFYKRLIKDFEEQYKLGKEYIYAYRKKSGRTESPTVKMEKVEEVVPAMKIEDIKRELLSAMQDIKQNTATTAQVLTTPQIVEVDDEEYDEDEESPLEID